MQAGNRDFIMGVVVGAAAGSIVGLVLAADSGEETRKRIVEAAGQARHKADEMAAKGREYVREQKSRLQVAVEAGRRAAEEKRAELEAEINEQTRPTATVTS